MRTAVRPLRQTAFYEPRGLLGYAYWYSVVPFHEFIFGNMSTRIVQEAEARERMPAGSESYSPAVPLS